MTVREKIQNQQQMFLSKYATKCTDDVKRKIYEEPCPLRTAFQRDRDKIIHSEAFRRLKQKTQVFLSPESDFYRTRLTHTLEVSQIARTIARGLFLNEDLTEAISLGHDVGHTPFGHAGERALNALNPEGFYHNLQSVRVFTKLEKDLKGLNLTELVLDGIENHVNKSKEPKTLEGFVVRVSDRIAYLNHDIEDAIKAKILEQSDIPLNVVNVLGKTKSERITTLITDVVVNSEETICMSDEVKKAYMELYDFMFAKVYLNIKAKKEEGKVKKLISELYNHFLQYPEKMPINYQFIAKQEGIHRAITDYISGMSDEYAIKRFDDLFVPKKWIVSK